MGRCLLFARAFLQTRAMCRFSSKESIHDVDVINQDSMPTVSRVLNAHVGKPVRCPA